MKRTFDIVAAFLLLLVSVPLFAIIGIVIKSMSRGPAFFGHERCARGGGTFRCLKFRTMVVDAEDWLERDPSLKAQHQQNGFKLRRSQDPRVTLPGRLLRYTHLDELPQLINVIRGEMSLVGPRPIVEDELHWYGAAADELLEVRPGVFGPWTAQGRRRVDYPGRTDVELAYVRDHGLLKDVMILLRNVPVLLTGQIEE